MAKHRARKRHAWKACGYMAPGYVKKPWSDSQHEGKSTRAILKRALSREIQEMSQ